MIKPGPQIWLIAQPGALPNEAMLVRVVRSMGASIERLDTMEYLAERLCTGASPGIVLAHIRSILYRPQDMDLYLSFLRAFAALQATYGLRLVIISPPNPGDYAFCSAGNVVDAYVTEKADLSVLRSFLRRLAEAEQEAVHV